jgi:Spy/CpxP family protein refolding chaperone
MRTSLFWLAWLAATLGTSSLRAQNLPEVVIHGHDKRTGILRKLDLSPAQRARINTLIDEEQAQRKQRLTHQPNEQEHAARLARQADFETKISAVLTPEQLDKYQELRGLKPRHDLPDRGDIQIPGSTGPVRRP